MIRVLNSMIALLCVAFSLQAQPLQKAPWFSEFPAREASAGDPAMEAFVEARLAQMTTEEKVAQMLMVEHNAITPEEAKQYKIGAMLHAGGQAVFYGRTAVSYKCRTATYLSLSCWNELADAYWTATKQAHWENNGQAIPVLWGTDAMHGAGAIHGATLFPHNIGLGAMIWGNDDEIALSLFGKMHEATREQVALQGFRQIFGPAVSVARNTEWGRTYESLSEDPGIAYFATPYAVRGIQKPWMDGTEQRMASTLKHYIGDGGTTTGTGHVTKQIDKGYDPTDTAYTFPRTDRGLNEYNDSLLWQLFAAPYFSGIAQAGAMSVMVSFNSWKHGPMHADSELIQHRLKDMFQFDGVVLTDWEGHAIVDGCTVSDCPEAINAGIDMFMIGFADMNAWKDFYNNTLNHVRTGVIPMARIDDAARRIIRMKYRLGFFNTPEPSLPSQNYRAFGYDSVQSAQAQLDQWAPLALTMAEKSMVLMKNNGTVLPLDPARFTTKTPLLVAGNALDSPAMQVGGWSLFWQGFARGAKDAFTNKEHYPQTVTVLDALKKQAIPICEWNKNARCAAAAKTALVVMGEHSYAEWYGDIHVADGQSIAYKTIREEYAQNEQLVKDLKAKGYEVITVFYSGRPLVVDALENSDAFVAGFLPGSQGGNAVLQLLFGATPFTGRLPMAWPEKVEDTARYHSMPINYPYGEEAWLQSLIDGNAQEVLAGPDAKYPIRFGL